VAGVTTQGRVKTLRMKTMGNPQPSPKRDDESSSPMDAVHRLDVGGLGGDEESSHSLFLWLKI
jgi:hypothetical protein